MLIVEDLCVPREAVAIDLDHAHLSTEHEKLVVRRRTTRLSAQQFLRIDRTTHTRISSFASNRGEVAAQPALSHIHKIAAAKRSLILNKANPSAAVVRLHHEGAGQLVERQRVCPTRPPIERWQLQLRCCTADVVAHAQLVGEQSHERTPIVQDLYDDFLVEPGRLLELRPSAELPEMQAAQIVSIANEA